MKSLFRVLKSSCVTVDANHSVTIDILDYPENEAEQVAAQSGAGDAREEAGAAYHSPETLMDMAGQEAERIIQIARQEANSVLRQARETADDMTRTAEADGYAEGYEKGYTQGRREAEALVEEARQNLDAAVRQREQMISAVEGELLELIVKVANKLLTDTIHINPQVIMALIRSGLGAANASGDVVIRVSEGDYATVVENKDMIAKSVEASSKIDIIKDLSLATCDCIIETPYGNIDCSLERQFDTLVENLYRVYNRDEAQFHISE